MSDDPMVKISYNVLYYVWQGSFTSRICMYSEDKVSECVGLDLKQ